MKIKKRLLAIVLSSALIMSNLSTAGFSVVAEDMVKETDVVNAETREELYESNSTSENKSDETTKDEDLPGENEAVNETDEKDKNESENEATDDTREESDTETPNESDTELEKDFGTESGEMSDIESEKEAETETEKESDTKSENEAADDTEKETETAKEENHIPENITNQITQIKLNLGNAWYMDSEYGVIDLEEHDSLVDYSTVSNISTVGLDVLYRLTQDGSDRTVRAGDWYEITLPSIAENIRMTGGESFGSDMPMDILDIQIQGNTIKATFKQTINDVNITQIHGKQHIAFEINKAALTEDFSYYTVSLQPENNCNLKFPEKATIAEDAISEISDIDLEKINVVKETFQALLNEFFENIISEEQSTEEIYDAIYSVALEMDEEGLNSCGDRTMEAIEAFNTLSDLEADYFSENESYLYNTVMDSLSEVLSTLMMNEAEQMSLLPLKEIKAYLILNGKSEESLKNMSLDEVLSELVDKNGNSIQILPEATTVWKYEKDNSDNIETYKKYAIGNGETIDLSAAGNVLDYQLELIVGSEYQLDPNNERYIIKVYISEKIAEEFSFELYSQLDNQRIKIEPKRQEVVQSDSALIDSNGNRIPAWHYAYYLDEGEYENPYLGMSSLMGERPDIRLEVFELDKYLDGIQIPVTNQVLDQNMSLPNAGYHMTAEGVSFLVLYYVNDIQVDVIALTFMITGSASELTGELYADDNGSRVLVSDTIGYSFSIKDGPLETYTFSLDPGYSADDEYALCLNAISGINGDVNEKIEKAVLGYYDSLEEAQGEEDIKGLLFSDKGYKASFGAEGKIFTIFFKDYADFGISNVYHARIKAKSDGEILQSFTEDPIIGQQDPWFRVIGAQKEDGQNCDFFVVENGKTMNVDTSYAYGYQTVLFSDPDIISFQPQFKMVDSEKIYVEAVFADSKPYNYTKDNDDTFIGEELQFPSDGSNILDVLFGVKIVDENGEHTKNYAVRFIKKTSSAKLYVAGPVAPNVRSVFLDEYFEYKHDIFIANIGKEPLKNLRLDLNATNVALDSYWTIGGPGNNVLPACPENFSIEQMKSSHGVLPNVAKIRLVPDGEKGGEIEGTLKIYSGDELLETILLSGRAQNPVIITDSLEDTVKYVPYSCMIMTNNMYDWNSVKFSISDADRNKLESIGMTFNVNTGELYGAPLAAGQYSFTVTAEFGKKEFPNSTQRYTLTVLDNDNTTVFNTSDLGYSIIPTEDGDVGYVGEQVSEYDFVVTSFDDDDMYISEGEYGQFVKLWLNGEVLVDGVDYTKAPGSTKITIKAQTLQNKTVNGRNTISAEYNVDGERGKKLKRTSQNFRVDIKTPTPDPGNPTPDPGNPTPDPGNPTPDPGNPTPDPGNPTPDPGNPTPDPGNPTPKPGNPTSTPNPSNPDTDLNNPTSNLEQNVVNIANTVTMKVSAVDGNDSPLENTTMEIHSTPKTATTDADGNATFRDIEFGEHTIYVKNAEGAILASKSFELVDGSSVSVNGNQIIAPKGSDISLKIKVDNGEINFESATLISAPKTGDNAEITLWLILLLLSMFEIIMLFGVRKKRRA